MAIQFFIIPMILTSSFFFLSWHKMDSQDGNLRCKNSINILFFQEKKINAGGWFELIFKHVI